ncbi:Transcription factor bHLH47 [Striga hermonthica]|uniref:Transcription factor bHLH47 n=1 Tax=Striga hermonthica TaxID=68872 RepID=A0A9N7RF02_STRHE|nr:Transcription factor bHLH47 [Striga hermonthica]
MGSETDEQVDDCVKESPRRTNPGKITRKIHKAAREKLKRDRMNELFTDLGRTLDLDHMSNGKASILRETIRLVGELLAQVESLKKENVTLFSECNYVTAERDELQEETSTLDAQIKKLQKEINERANCEEDSGLSGKFPLKLTEDHSAPAVGPPLIVMPLAAHESQVFSVPFTEANVCKAPANVSKPRARYPSSSDSWPSHILAQSDNYGLVDDVRES